MPEETTKAGNIYAALLAAQKDMGPVYKNASNPAFKSKYADLGVVVETVTEALQKHNILLLQPLVMVDGEQQIETILHHVDSDTSIESFFKVVCKDPSDPQKVGGAITYGRRYSLLSLLGIAPEDDDANAASQPANHSGGQQYNRPAAAPASHAASQSAAAPAAKARVLPGDLVCEIEGCTNTVWKSKEAETRKWHDGHIICHQHSLDAQTPWDMRPLKKQTYDYNHGEYDNDPNFIDPSEINL